MLCCVSRTSDAVVRDLAGYSLGRSDLDYAEPSAKGSCDGKNGKIFYTVLEMKSKVVSKMVLPKWQNKYLMKITDFAKYAFNKSHAACYAVSWGIKPLG